MRRSLGVALTVSLVALFTSSASSGPYGGGGGVGGGGTNKLILSFKTMYGVDTPFLAANPIRGVLGDDLPWVVKSAKGTLSKNGKLSIQIKGLVFPNDPRVPPELRGINDEAEFRALVSCVTVDDGTVVEQNIITDGFPANEKGNAKLKTTIDLPQPCLAPIIMILAGDVDAWFSITGF